ncbi:MAG: rod shape-determining protein MreD [Rikenellaceae bacterium]
MAVTLLQILFFNNLSVSVSLSPLVYVAFILLLPLQVSHFAILMVGLLMGLLMDWSMGLAGINTISTLFIAFFRPYLLNMVVTKEVLAGSGIPSDIRLGTNSYIVYLIFLILIHHAIFFGLESLSFANYRLYVVRFLVSSACSILFVWLIGRAFVVAVFRKK